MFSLRSAMRREQDFWGSVVNELWMFRHLTQQTWDLFGMVRCYAQMRAWVGTQWWKATFLPRLVQLQGAMTSAGDSEERTDRGLHHGRRLWTHQEFLIALTRSSLKSQGKFLEMLKWLTIFLKLVRVLWTIVTGIFLGLPPLGIENLYTSLKLEAS